MDRGFILSVSIAFVIVMLLFGFAMLCLTYPVVGMITILLLGLVAAVSLVVVIAAIIYLAFFVED